MSDSSTKSLFWRVDAEALNASPLCKQPQVSRGGQGSECEVMLFGNTRTSSRRQTVVALQSKKKVQSQAKQLLCGCCRQQPMSRAVLLGLTLPEHQRHPRWTAQPQGPCAERQIFKPNRTTSPCLQDAVHLLPRGCRDHMLAAILTLLIRVVRIRTFLARLRHRPRSDCELPSPCLAQRARATLQEGSTPPASLITLNPEAALLSGFW